MLGVIAHSYSKVSMILHLAQLIGAFLSEVVSLVIRALLPNTSPPHESDTVLDILDIHVMEKYGLDRRPQEKIFLRKLTNFDQVFPNLNLKEYKCSEMGLM